MGHKHTKEEILQGALEAALEDGFSQLTFGRLAKRLGISDRVVVYYFPTKGDLIGEVIVAMGLLLQEALAPAFETLARDHREVVQRCWPLIASPENDRVFALFFEANGMAVVGREPYASLAPTLTAAWIEWIANLLVDTSRDKQAEAEAALTLIEGLSLVRLLAGPEAANRSAVILGGA